MGCFIDSYVVGQGYEMDMNFHTCEECGNEHHRHSFAIYEGLSYRDNVPTHIFQEEGYHCPECGAGIEQINVPCGGITNDAFAQERVGDCIGIPIPDQEYDTDRGLG